MNYRWSLVAFGHFTVIICTILQGTCTKILLCSVNYKPTYYILMIYIQMMSSAYHAQSMLTQAQSYRVVIEVSG